MYLARTQINGSANYVIRETYQEGDLFLSRDLFQLGGDPSQYIIYPGGNAFYFDETLIDGLESTGSQAEDDELEDIFWPFLKPHIQRVLEPFRRRENLTRTTRRKKDRGAIDAKFHMFDKRRIHFLKFGGMDQRNLGRLPASFFAMLYHKSRDEIEQRFIQLERILKPTELKAYTYVIFDLKQYFSEAFAADTPELLDQAKMDDCFVEQICRLNQDASFWAGMALQNSLHEYLARYACLYFDFDYAPRSFIDDYIRQFINSHKAYRPPPRPTSEILQDAEPVFGLNTEKLKAMSRKDLARLYRRKAMKLHPDQGGDHDKFVKLTRTYHELLKTKK